MKRKEAEEVPGLQMSKAKMSRSKENNNSADEKSKKYDRQLRLWGDHGQKELENAKICLINATATGVETLKCLILPGIGKYVIVDNENVKEEDLGNNFFLDEKSLGKPRAHCACQLLQELNQDAVGSSFVQDPGELVENDPEFYKQFTFVIASDVRESVLIKLSELLWRSNIPILVCCSRGYIGYIRLAVREHTVVEAHPDNSHEDLRLDKPFPDLVEYMNAMDLDKMNKQEHGHTPFLVIIYKYLEKWKQEHQDCWPKNFKEKKEFKEIIARGVLKNEHGVEEIEENFEEAVRNVNNVLIPGKVPNNLEDIFKSHHCEHPNNLLNINFWILARAVKEFLNNTGSLPLRGSIPDMFSDSARYIQLQTVYKNQATKDTSSVSEIVQQCLIDLQMDEDLITDEEVKTFCKNVHYLHAIHGRPLGNELRHSTEGNSHIADLIGDDEDSLGVLYLILRAVNAFEEQEKRLPGTVNSSLEQDFDQIKVLVDGIKKALHAQVNVKDELIREICRCGAAEIHTLAAIIGGIAAQEVIKVLTKQFVPLNNTFIYNAITETSLAFEL